MNQSVLVELDPADSASNLGADERLRALGVTKTIDTFTVARHVNFVVGYRVTQYVRITGSSGYLLNLGEGSWLYAGTTSGTPNDVAWNFEYQSADDSLIIQIGNRMAKFMGVSSTDSAVQIRKDITGMPTLVLVRRDIVIDSRDDDYALRARASSFIQFS